MKLRQWIMNMSPAPSMDGGRLAIARRDLMRAGAFGALAGLAPGFTQAFAETLAPPPAGKTHELPSTKQTVSSGVLDPTRPPAITIDSGDVVHYPNTWTHWGNEAKYGMDFVEREPIRKRYPTGPYSNVGPVEIRGAEPGDVVELRWLKMRPIDWGWNSFPLGVGALPHYFDRPYLRYVRFNEARDSVEFLPGVKVPLAPFQGVVAVQPAGDKPVSAILAGAYGGNLNLPELVVGTSLFLPVQRPGALIWTSDSNAVQGDGVVDQTAIETAMEDMRIQFVLHKRMPLDGPLVETPTHWILTGYGSSLDDALTECVTRTITVISRLSGLDPRDVYALASIAVNYRVTQYSNQTGSVYATVPPKAIHGMVPKSIFSPELLARMDRSSRNAA